MVIVSISIPDELLEELDRILNKEWYVSRSEILRQALRKYISEYKSIEQIEGGVIATLSVLYEKEGGIADRIKHEFGDIIIAFIHLHVNGGECLEVMVIKGMAERLRKLMDGLRASDTVKQLSFSLMSFYEPTKS